MMLTPEQISEIIEIIVDKKNKGGSSIKSKVASIWSNQKDDHMDYNLPDYYPGYKISIEWLDQIRIHAQKGVYPHKLFEKQAPNQTKVEAEYVRANFKQNTIQVFKDMVDTYGRAYHENNWNITYTIDADQYVNTETTLQQYLDYDFPEYGSLENFVFTFLPPLKLMDAMGVVAIMPYDIPVIEREGEEIIDPDILIQPYTKFYHTDRVIFFDDDEYCIIESEEKSNIEFNGKIINDGLVYLFFDSEWIYKVIQVGKKKDWQFELIPYFNHATGKIPVKRVDGITIQINETILQQSPFLYAVDILDEVLLDSALLRGIKPTCTYPYRIMVGDVCEFQIKIDGEMLTCDNGYHYRADGSKSICPECSGSGAKDRVSPFGTLLIKPSKGTQMGDQISPNNAMAYVSPSTETSRFLREEIATHIQMAYDILHLKKTDNNVQGGLNITATEVASDQKALIAGIRQNCIQLFDMYEWCIDMIGLMRYGSNYRKPIISRPVNYDFYLEADYMAQINQAIASNQPPFVIQSIIYKYLQTLYYPDVQGQKVFNLISQTDRLMTMSNDEINLKSAKGYVDKWEVILHDSSINFVNQLLLENNKFFELDFEIQKQQLIDKAKQVTMEIGSNSMGSFNGQTSISNMLVAQNEVDLDEEQLDTIGKVPLALQQLALAQERALKNGNEKLAKLIGNKMNDLLLSIPSA